LWIKLFSSKRKQKLSTLKKIISYGLKKISKELFFFLAKIINFWIETGEESMQTIQQDLTNELLGGLNEEVIKFFITSMNPEKVMKQFKPEDRLKGIKPEDRLKGLNHKELQKLKKILNK